MRWTIVIPVKALPSAKSRLTPASPDVGAHRRLVEAIRADTVAAARAADGVARVVLVADRPLVGAASAGPDGVLVQSRPGLNEALEEAAQLASRSWPADGVAALVGDLPALRPDELAEALVVAAEHPRSFVPDADGGGTTLLAAIPGVALGPSFGTGSASRHASGSAAIDARPGLRHDVDTADDLARAAELGLGAATSAELAHGNATQSSTGSGIVGPWA